MFTNPLLLFFLPLALAPILLHLLTRYRLRTVELSTFRFLMDSYFQQRRRMKLLEYLLMLLRVAFVMLIVMVLSRPVVQQFGWLAGGGSGRDVMLVVDAGAHMALRTGGAASLERAKQAARGIITDLLGPEDYLTVIRGARKPDIVAGVFAAQPQAALAAVDAIQVAPTPSDLAAALAEAVAQPPRGPRLCYLITDGSAAAWRDMPNHPALKQLDPGDKLVVINVGPAAVADGDPAKLVNLAAVGQPPAALRPVVGLPVLLQATVANGSPDHSADAALSVMLDDELVDQLKLTLEPGQTLTRPITVTPTRAGLIKGRFELPTDVFPDDDQYLFCLNVEPKLDVLIVHDGGGRRGGRGGLALAQRAEVYIRAALTSPLSAQAGAGDRAGGAPAGQPSERQIAESLAIESAAPAELSDSRLARVDVVVLADANLDRQAAARLRRYVEAGGGLMILPGPSVDPQLYNRFLLGATTRPGVSTAPLLSQPQGDIDDEASFAPVTSIRLAHPVLSAFDEPDGDFFTTARLYRYFPIQMPEVQSAPSTGAPAAGAAAQSLLKLPNDQTVLAAFGVGRGRVLLAGFPATPNWSNLPLKPEFVPILLRGVAHLRRASAVRVSPSVRPNQPAAIRVIERWRQAQVQVRDPAGRPHTVELQRSENDLLGAMMQTGDKGYYTVRITPRSPDAPDQVTAGFAVNLDPGASDFTMLSEAEITKLLHPIEPVYLQGAPDDPVLTTRLTQKQEIWRPLIWAMFAIIGLEFLLATLRSAPADAAGQTPGQVQGAQAQRQGPLARLLALVGIGD